MIGSSSITLCTCNCYYLFNSVCIDWLIKVRVISGPTWVADKNTFFWPKQFLFEGDSEDADADSSGFHGEELLHYHGHVSLDLVLCLCRCHNVWMCEVWWRSWQVGYTDGVRVLWLSMIELFFFIYFWQRCLDMAHIWHIFGNKYVIILI